MPFALRRRALLATAGTFPFLPRPALALAPAIGAQAK